jgi:hypothetical protein
MIWVGGVEGEGAFDAICLKRSKISAIQYPVPATHKKQLAEDAGCSGSPVRFLSVELLLYNYITDFSECKGNFVGDGGGKCKMYMKFWRTLSFAPCNAADFLL